MKKCQKDVLVQRAYSAYEDTYHNASVVYPAISDDESELFAQWFDIEILSELENLNDKPYHEIPYVPANSGVRHSDELKVQLRYTKFYSDRYYRLFPYMKISNYGEVSQYGRGGRTVKPSGLHKNPLCFDKWSVEELTEFIIVMESFNDYVHHWCREVPYRWEIFREEIE